MAYVIETENLCKQYKETMAVSGVNMHVQKGDIYGFIGRNGAGKSTTLKMLNGLIYPSAGKIRLFGEERNQYSGRRIGALIENAGLYPHLSAYANMNLKATAMGLHQPDEIIALLSLVKLDFKSRKPVKKFSLGMKQRLGIAMALLGQPDLLILDEPINGLDPEGIREIREIITTLNEQRGMTIIISSHILGELSKVATRYGIIRAGELVEEISADDLDRKCRSYLSLVVDDPKRALGILESQVVIQDYQVIDSHEIWIYDELDSAQVNAWLVSRQVQVSQLYYQKQDLESYFLEKIGGTSNA